MPVCPDNVLDLKLFGSNSILPSIVVVGLVYESDHSRLNSSEAIGLIEQNKKNIDPN